MRIMLGQADCEYSKPQWEIIFKHPKLPYKAEWLVMAEDKQEALKVFYSTPNIPPEAEIIEIRRSEEGYVQFDFNAQ